MWDGRGQSWSWDYIMPQKNLDPRVHDTGMSHWGILNFILASMGRGRGGRSKDK